MADEGTQEKTRRFDPQLPKDVVAMKKVNAAGNITGLRDHVGKEFLLVRVPDAIQSDKVAGAVDRPRSLLRELLDAAREHGELTKEQMERFREKYGQDLSGEEFRTRVKEMNAVVRTQVESFAKDIEARYERLEEDLESRFDTLVRSRRDDVDTGTHTIDLEEEQAPGEGADLPDRDG